MDTENPYEVPSGDLSPPTAEPAPDRPYGGIGRLAYLGGSTLIVVVGLVLEDAARSPAAVFGPEVGQLVVPLAMTAALAVLAGQRLKNIGLSPWFGGLMIVPLINSLVAFVCLALPEGFADHRKSDAAARILIGLLLAAVALAMVGTLVAALRLG